MYLERIVTDMPALSEPASRRNDALEAFIARSIEIKAEIVRRDERETGLRQVLNFGHTVGHAVEAASKYTLLHGVCVGIGMVYEAMIAVRMGIASSGTARDVKRAVERAGLPVSLPSDISVDQLMSVMRSDKKVRSSALRLALPREIGMMASGDGTWSVPVEESLVRVVLSS
jgi:3-dehydroquinate synthase